jgi:hypothetical protein
MLGVFLLAACYLSGLRLLAAKVSMDKHHSQPAPKLAQALGRKVQSATPTAAVGATGNFGAVTGDGHLNYLYRVIN